MLEVVSPYSGEVISEMQTQSQTDLQDGEQNRLRSGRY